MAIGIRTGRPHFWSVAIPVYELRFSFSSRERLLRSYVLSVIKKVQAPLSCPLKCPTSVLPTSEGTLAALVVGYGMGHASSGDFRLPLVWWVAAALVSAVTVGVLGALVVAP